MVSAFRTSWRAPPLHRRPNACPGSFPDLVGRGRCLLSSFSSRFGRRAVPRAMPSLCRNSQCWPKAAHQRFPPSGVNGHHPYCLFTRVITTGLLALRRSGIEGVHLHNCVVSQIIGSGEDQEQKNEEPQKPESHIGFRRYRYRTRRTNRLEIDGPRRVGGEPGGPNGASLACGSFTASINGVVPT